MSLWHADIDEISLEPGANLTVFSPHQAVRVVTSDQVSIRTSTGDRVAAHVLDRTGSDMTLVFPDGQVARLSIVTDHSIRDHWQPGEVFSQQGWIVN